MYNIIDGESMLDRFQVLVLTVLPYRSPKNEGQL